jgi:hypothetical protein
MKRRSNPHRAAISGRTSRGRKWFAPCTLGQKSVVKLLSARRSSGSLRGHVPGFYANLTSLIRNAWCQTFLVVTLSSVLPAAGATYYLDRDKGDDSRTGTSPTAAWQSLERLNSAKFVAGDQIFFRAGCEWEGAFRPLGSGREGRLIVVDRYGDGPNPALHGRGRVSAVLRLENQSCWEIQNLEITNYAESGPRDLRGVEILARDCGWVRHIHLKNLDIHDVNGISDYKNDGDAVAKSFGGITTIVDGDQRPTAWDDLCIEDCTIHDVGPAGIAMLSSWTAGHRNNDPKTWFPSRRVVIRGNRIERTARNGLIVRGCVAPLIERNVFNGCAHGGSGNACFAFHCDDALFQFNESCFTRYNSGDTDATGFDSDFNCRRSVFQFNYSHDNEYGFIVVCNRGPTGFNDGTIVRYNVSQNDGGNVFRISGAVTNTRIYNNTIYVGAGMTNPKNGDPPRIIFHKEWNHGWSDRITFSNNVIVNLCKEAVYTHGQSTHNQYCHNLFFGEHPASEPADPMKCLADPRVVNAGGAGLGIASAVAAYLPRPGAPALGAGRTLARHWRPDGLMQRATVVPRELTDAVLHNPDMGWVLYENYPVDQDAHGSSTLLTLPDENFGGVDTVAIMFSWQDVEQRPDEYDFSKVDFAYDYWAKRGKAIQLRISSASLLWWANRTPPAGAGTPDYVLARLAPNEKQTRDLQGVKYTVEDARNPYYRERLAKFLLAVDHHFSATRPVTLIDLRGFGAWGEWHSGFKYPTLDQRRAALKDIIDVWSESLPDHRLALSASYDPDGPTEFYAGPNDKFDAGSTGKYADFLQYSAFDYALTKANVTFRRDGCGGAVHSNERKLIHEASRLGRGPMFSEFVDGYWNSKAGGSKWIEWKIDDALSLCPNYINLLGWQGADSLAFMHERRDLFDTALRKMGYRLVPTRVEYPASVIAGKTFNIEIDWINRGVGRALRDYELNVSLVDAEGRIQATAPMEKLETSRWVAGKTYTATVNVNSPKVADGKYELAIGMDDPLLKRPIELPLDHRRSDGGYPIGAIRMADRQRTSDEVQCGRTDTPQ